MIIRNIGAFVADQFDCRNFRRFGKISFSLLLTTAIAVILKLVCDTLSAIRADCALFHPFGETLRMEIVSAKRLEVTSVVSANGAHIAALLFRAGNPLQRCLFLLFCLLFIEFLYFNCTFPILLRGRTAWRYLYFLFFAIFLLIFLFVRVTPNNGMKFWLLGSSLL